jgi:Tol biopolymer transport system component
MLMIAAIGLAAAALRYLKTSPPEAVLTPVPLTTYPGFESSPSFSPDGEQVAFSWCEHEAAPTWLSNYPNVCNIYVKQIGMEPPSRLTEGMTNNISPAWSPDGRWIAFLRVLSTARLALLVIPQRGGRERILQEYDTMGAPGLPQGPHLAWTPDSQWIVCPTPARQRWGLSLVSVNTAARQTLSTPPDSDDAIADTSPSISPDGRTVVFSRNIKGGIYDLYKLRLSARYTPEGEPVALGAQDRQVFGPAWLSNGAEILFASGLRGERGLWRISTAGAGPPQRLPFAPSFASEPVVSSRGHRLAYTDYREDSNIWKVDLAGPNGQAGAPVQVISSTRVDDLPAPSPDGTRLAFVSNRTGAREVWVCEADGSHQQQLTSCGGPWIHAPRWSPDGQTISVTVSEPGREQALGLIDVKSGAMRVLSIPGDVKWPTWSPDGRWLYFSAAAGSLWKIRPAGGVPMQLTSGTEDMPHASLDGKFIYYMKGWPGPMSIWRMPVEGGEGTRIVEGVGYRGEWTVGEDGVYFFALADAVGRSDLRVYDFATSRIKTILTAEKAPGCKLAVSPGDRTIYYAQTDEHGSDLMLVENFR